MRVSRLCFAALLTVLFDADAEIRARITAVQPKHQCALLTIESNRIDGRAAVNI